MSTICLNMIVKDEAHVIARCLDSVRPFIDTWVIVDTGSTDGTQDRIRELLRDLPGELHERPWKDFGHNRTEALELARGKADYVMVIDADEVLLTDPGFKMPPLTADAYETVHEVGAGAHTFYLVQLMKSALPFRYVGVLHEVAHCDTPYQAVPLPGLRCRGMFDSARNKNPREKYLRDARVLEEALAAEPDNSRYCFYLAQSYRDAGEIEPAIEAYGRRARMGGWPEEAWHARWQQALLLLRAGRESEAIARYIEAFQERPTRAEPLCDLAAHYRKQKQHHAAYLFARRATEIAMPADRLFIDRSVYRWRARDELSIAAYWVGDYQLSEQLCRALLTDGSLPESERERVEKNLAFATDKLAGSAKAARNKKKQHRRGRR